MSSLLNEAADVVRAPCVSSAQVCEQKGNPANSSDKEDNSNNANGNPANESKKKKKKKKKPNSAAASNPSDTAAFAEAAAAHSKQLSAYDSMKVSPIVTDLPDTYQYATDSLAKKVNSHINSQFQFAIYSNSADSLGRRAIAIKDLKAGQLLLREIALPSVIHQQYNSQVCHNPSCSASLLHSNLAQNHEQNQLKVQVMGCKTCEKAFYCSNQCENSHKEVHSVECAVLKQVEKISDEALVNVDLLRALLAYLVLRKGRTNDDSNSSSSVSNSGRINGYNNNNSSDISCNEGNNNSHSDSKSADPSPAIKFDDFRPNWQDNCLMISNIDSMSPVDKQNCTNAAQSLMRFLPATYHLPVADCLDYLNRVNNNAHALALPQFTNIHYGFGLFPLCSIFNHSCYPNCTFSNAGAKLQIRTIRTAQKNEELTVNYISLYAAAPARRLELLQSKKFHCNCRRCVLQPTNEEEKAKFLADQYLGAVLCQSRANCEGIYRLQRPITIESPSNSDKWDPESIKPVLVCSNCGCRADMPALSKLEMTARERCESLIQQYSSGVYTANVLRQNFELSIAEFSSKLHRNHEFFFNLLLPLINCYSQLKEFKMKLDCVQRAIEMSEAISPANFPPLANYYQAAADTLQSLINSRQNLPKKLWQKYHEEKVSWLEKMSAVYLNAYGAGHFSTNNAIQQLAQARNSKQISS
jgi:hypothetical protein